MPPKQKFTKEEIVSAALNLVRKEGAEALTARSLGDALQSSARPIFTVFENMAQVRDEVKKAAEEIYNQYIREGLKEKYPFKGTGKAYVRMAREEPNLFRLLFMTGAPQVPKMDDLMRYIDTISTSVTDAAKESFEVTVKRRRSCTTICGFTATVSPFCRQREFAILPMKKQTKCSPRWG